MILIIKHLSYTEAYKQESGNSENHGGYLVIEYCMTLASIVFRITSLMLDGLHTSNYKFYPLNGGYFEGS